ncbi:MAG: ESX secretion-associated protein EspG [Pseudonocardiaceae bacterium]|nr:ESX secretion-associated protein EspG [Pseudonocardiaceae bacterium]
MTFWNQINVFGLNGQEIFHNFRGGTGDDGRGLYRAAFSVQRVVKNYEDRTKSITNLTGKMENAWEGDAAGAARRGAGPLAVEHGLAKSEMFTAHSTLHNQVDAFIAAKGAVTEVPPTPEKPGFWHNVTTLGDAGRTYEDQMTQVNAANDHNVAVMERYEGETDTNTSSMPTTYGRITDDYAAVGVRYPTPPPYPLPYEPPDSPGNPNDGNSNNNNTFTNPNQTQSPSQNQLQQPNQDQLQNTNQHQTNPNDFRPTSPAEQQRGLPPGQNPGQPGQTGLPGVLPPSTSFGPNTGGARGPWPGRGRRRARAAVVPGRARPPRHLRHRRGHRAAGDRRVGTPVLDKPLTLHAEALARLVRMENLGDLHVTLKPLAVWRRKSDQDALETEARTEFLRLGLLDNRGRLDVELVASLAVLCRAGAEFYGWINEGDNTKGVLAGAIGREAVLAVRDGVTVTVTQIRPETLPMALVSQTPEVPPSRGETVNVLRSDMLASVGGRQRTAAGVGMRPAPPEVRIVQQIIAQPTTGGGELYVAVRDRMGRRRPVQEPLRYADTATGRWLNHMTTTPDGEQRILVTPATRGDLAARLQEMHKNLSR